MRALMVEELEFVSGGVDGGTQNNCGGVSTGSTTGSSACSTGGQTVNREGKGDLQSPPTYGGSACIQVGGGLGLQNLGNYIHVDVNVCANYNSGGNSQQKKLGLSTGKWR